ncbi:hypothetical protein [Anaerotruncus colihominis]|uniref:hypothetical protein n=1 Tax=Anaerotruncus colihominis TaxID=169435 RepID=UPI0035112FC1
MAKRRPSGDGMVRKRDDGRWEGRTVYRKAGGGLTVGDTKTSASTRKIVLPSSTAALLSKRKASALTERIFPNPLKPEQPTNPGSAYRQLKVLLKQAGLPNIRFHDLRHPYVKPTTKIFYLLYIYYLTLSGSSVALFYQEVINLVLFPSCETYCTASDGNR